MIIAPNKQYLVDLYVPPLVLSTAYVQAVIKKAVSGETIATLNLTDQGSGYFSYLWNVPADPTGTGTQIKIFKTVYTDSGYTSPAVEFNMAVEDYIVRDLPVKNTGGFSSGLATAFGRGQVDYDKIEKIIVKVIDGRKEEKYDDSNIKKGIEELKEEMDEHFENYDDLHSSKMDEVHGSLQKKFDETIYKLLSSKEFQELRKVNQLPEKFKEAENSDDRLHAYIENFIKGQDLKIKDIKSEVEKSSNGMKAITQQFFNDLATEIHALIKKYLARPVTLQINASPKLEEAFDEEGDTVVDKKRNQRSSAISNLLNR